MSSTLDQELAPFLTVTTVIVEPIATLSLQFFVYGLYCVIFGICMYTLCQRKTMPNRGLVFGWTISLFALASLLVFFKTWLWIRQATIVFVAAKTHSYDALLAYLQDDMIGNIQSGFLDLIPTLINIIADWILIYRCYVIWQSWKIIGWSLSLLSFAVNAWSLADVVISIYALTNTFDPAKQALAKKEAKSDTGADITMAIVNAIVTLLTAGRIWWITRGARKLMGKPIANKYKNIVAILLESGILYPTAMIIYQIIASVLEPSNNGVVPIQLSTVVFQIAGMAPTLIIVRAASGKAIESVDQVISTLSFADNEYAGSTSLRPRMRQRQEAQASSDVLDLSRTL